MYCPSERLARCSNNRIAMELAVLLFVMVSPGTILGQSQQAPPAAEQSQTQAAPAPSQPPDSQGQMNDQDPGTDSRQNAPPEYDPQPRPGWRRFSGQTSYDQGSSSQPAAGIPPQLTLQPGTYITVRVNQYLSSDKNQPGDGFYATLAKPLVADGIVVAQRGQTVGGRVVEAQKAGRVKGVSRLGLTLEDLTLVDGRQVHIETQFSGQIGSTSKARDAGAIATTGGLGAAIGAAAGGGTGAAIGAGSGAVAATIGVLLTRGHATEIYPETELTFRLSAPVTISTERAPQAFRYVTDSDYQQPAERSGPPRLRSRACPPYGCPPPYYVPYYPYWGPPYPYFWGPSVSFWFGRSYYGRGYYGHRYHGHR
jgi:hypothetical protein